MEKQFEAILTSPETSIDGVVTKIQHKVYNDAYDFKSIDGDVHLVIAKDEDGNWLRVAGTEPYLSGWVDELAEQII